jgi:hypothetical protein
MSIRKHVLLMSSVFGSSYRCEQLFSIMKNVRSRTRTRLTDEHLDGCMRIATTEIKRILKDYCRKSSAKYLTMIEFVTENY